MSCKMRVCACSGGFLDGALTRSARSHGSEAPLGAAPDSRPPTLQSAHRPKLCSCRTATDAQRARPMCAVEPCKRVPSPACGPNPEKPREAARETLAPRPRRSKKVFLSGDESPGLDLTMIALSRNAAGHERRLAHPRSAAEAEPETALIHLLT